VGIMKERKKGAVREKIALEKKNNTEQSQTHLNDLLHKEKGQKQNKQQSITWTGTDVLPIDRHTVIGGIKDAGKGHTPTNGPETGEERKDIGVDGDAQIGANRRAGRHQIGRGKGDARPDRTCVTDGNGKKDGPDNPANEIARGKGNDEPDAGQDDGKYEGRLDEELGNAKEEGHADASPTKGEHGNDCRDRDISGVIELRGITVAARGGVIHGIDSIGRGDADNGKESDVKQDGENGIIARAFDFVFAIAIVRMRRGIRGLLMVVVRDTGEGLVLRHRRPLHDHNGGRRHDYYVARKRMKGGSNNTVFRMLARYSVRYRTNVDIAFAVIHDFEGARLM
jgi:hypothetical protein